MMVFLKGDMGNAQRYVEKVPGGLLFVFKYAASTSGCSVHSTFIPCSNSEADAYIEENKR